MRWVGRIKREDDGSESDVIRIERSRTEDAAGLGLTLDGKRIMALLQKRVLTDQLRERCRSGWQLLPAWPECPLWVLAV